jgi:hypothetical protein
VADSSDEHRGVGHPIPGIYRRRVRGFRFRRMPSTSMRFGRTPANATAISPFRGYGFPAEIITHAVWLYHRFSVSHREVEEFLGERGVQVSYEAIRLWCHKFGPLPARALPSDLIGHLVDHWAWYRLVGWDAYRLHTRNEFGGNREIGLLLRIPNTNDDPASSWSVNADVRVTKSRQLAHVRQSHLAYDDQHIVHSPRGRWFLVSRGYTCAASYMLSAPAQSSGCPSPEYQAIGMQDFIVCLLFHVARTAAMALISISATGWTDPATRPPRRGH